jgi:A/G-specific adenine glycosylase
MLQQTQAAVVSDYFERWMARFPSLASLAEAPLDEVMKLWEGLGYYARARHLHAAARRIVQEQGEITPDALAHIKGLGPYTRGAILSFAFHQRAAAVDGNVKRVLARYFLVEEEVAAPSALRTFTALAESILPEEEPWIIMEALIELGAQICQKTPRCPLCPIRSGCRAYLEHRTADLPIRKRRAKTTSLLRFVAVVRANNALLLKREEAGKVMAGLYEFPYFDTLSQRALEKWLGCEVRPVAQLPEVRHTFTRYRVTLRPSVWQCQEQPCVSAYQWIPWERAPSLPLSSGHKRILRHVYSTH